MGPLIINAQVRTDIEAAKSRALAKPIPFDVLKAGLVDADRLVKLSDRAPGARRPSSEHVLIPVGFRASISYEQQPAGLCRHLSISVEPAGNLPNPVVIIAIAQEFGFHIPLLTGKAWMEEFAPGHLAVNLVELVDVASAGSA